MDEVNGEPKRDLTSEQWEKLIKLIDKQTSSPLQRSNVILEVIKKELPDVNTYDLWCFSIHILQTLIAEYPSLKNHLQIFNLFLYRLHYRLQLWRNIKE